MKLSELCTVLENEKCYRKKMRKARGQRTNDRRGDCKCCYRSPSDKKIFEQRPQESDEETYRGLGYPIPGKDTSPKVMKREQDWHVGKMMGCQVCKMTRE